MAEEDHKPTEEEIKKAQETLENNPSIAKLSRDLGTFYAAFGVKAGIREGTAAFNQIRKIQAITSKGKKAEKQGKYTEAKQYAEEAIDALNKLMKEHTITPDIMALTTKMKMDIEEKRNALQKEIEQHG